MTNRVRMTRVRSGASTASKASKASTSKATVASKASKASTSKATVASKASKTSAPKATALKASASKAVASKASQSSTSKAVASKASKASASKSSASKAAASKSSIATSTASNRKPNANSSNRQRKRQRNTVNAAHFAATKSAPQLLKGLNRHAQTEILSQCVVRRYAKGERIVRESERADGLYFIARGRAQATKSSACGSEVNFADLEQGAHFGEQSLINVELHATTVTALTDAHIIVMPPLVCRAMLECHPALAFGLLAHAHATVRDLSERVLEYSTVDVERRVRAELLRLAVRHFDLDGVARIPPMTHAKFAARVSCHREAVSRELKALQRAGVVTRQNRYFIVPDIARLRRLVEGKGSG